MYDEELDQSAFLLYIRLKRIIATVLGTMRI